MTPKYENVLHEVLIMSSCNRNEYLVVKVLSVSGRNMHCLIEINFEEVSNAAFCFFDARAFSVFANELRRVYENLNGAAELKSIDHDDCIAARVVDRGRGRLVVGGRLTTLKEAAYDTLFIQSERAVKGIEINFDGIELEQSFVPDIIKNFEAIGASHTNNDAS